MTYLGMNSVGFFGWKRMMMTIPRVVKYSGETQGNKNSTYEIFHTGKVFFLEILKDEVRHKMRFGDSFLESGCFLLLFPYVTFRWGLVV